MSTTYTNLLFHIVFSTKYRKNIITPEIQDRLYEYIGGILRKQKGILLQIGGMPDHVHILAKLSPTLAISDVIRNTKANSSKWCNESFRPTTNFAWQRGFGAFSVSFSNVAQVQKYIRKQQEHHQKISFADEFRQLLVRHGIEFDEQYLFEAQHIV